MNTMAMARAERVDLADLLDSLAPEQWRQPSLCAGWSLHDVACVPTWSHAEPRPPAAVAPA